MKREDIKNILVLVIFIALCIVAIRLFIYLLPVIIIALVGLLLYDSYKNKKFIWKEDKEKDNNKVKDAQIIKEKKN